MNLRRTVSMIMLFSFILMILTSIILYIVPQGRVAYWADWRMLGLSKEQWGNLHINLGFLFLASGLIHIFYNWKAIVSYMKDKSRKIKIVTIDFNIALILTLFFGIGTLLNIPPMSNIINLSESFKDKAEQRYGAPPYGHAELSSLEEFSQRMGLDLAESIQTLKENNISFNNSKQTLKEIAKQNNIPPQDIYLLIKGTKTDKKTNQNAPSGIGKRSLTDVCNSLNIDVQTAIQELSKINIKAEKNNKIKEIGENNNRSPREIYDILAGLSQE